LRRVNLADTTPPRRPESVLVVVFSADGLVLLMERRSPSGWWQSVTGALEPGETPREAAVREVREETGLAARGLVDLGLRHTFAIAPAWRHRYAANVTENLEHAFALRIPTAVEIILDRAEHVRYEWLPVTDAVARATSASNCAAIRHIAGRSVPGRGFRG
jgi:dihydroneopterin triphosphate diphosphatase